MKWNLSLIALGVAYGLVLRFMAVPLIFILDKQNQAFGLFFILCAWGLAFVVTACNMPQKCRHCGQEPN